MRQMSEPQSSLKEFVETDLRRGLRLMIAVQETISPQFRIATPEGDFWLEVTFGRDVDNCVLKTMQRIETFMAYKHASAFIMVTEQLEPSSVCSIGVSHRDVHVALSRITREPRPWTEKNFGPIEWAGPGDPAEIMWDFLPRGARSITDDDLAMLEELFGVNGRFPAVHMESREVRGLG